MKHLILSILAIFICNNILSQITIREEKIIEKPIIKPEPFDSLENICEQKVVVNYNKYLGQELYFIPKNTNYTGSYSNFNDTSITFLKSREIKKVKKTGGLKYEETALYNALFGNYSKNEIQKDRKLNKMYETQKQYHLDKIRDSTNIYKPVFQFKENDKTTGDIHGIFATERKSVEGKYFTILDIKAKDNYRSYNDDYVSLNKLDDYLPWRVSLKLKLLNNSTKDTLFWIVEQARSFNRYPFYLVSYFAKQKQLYEGNTLVANKLTNDIVDIKSGNSYTIKKGESWICKDVSFGALKSKKNLQPFYFLEDSIGRKIKIPLGGFDNESFILQSVYDERLRQKQLAIEEKRKEEKELEEERKQKQLNYKKKCISNYGTKYGNLIYEGKVTLGMTKEMCIASWGHPYRINKTTVSGLISEQWVYGWHHYLYFDNEKLTAIQN